jgi:dephospho-CoA kinase
MLSHSQQPLDKRLVVGITGRIGSGKTSVGNYLASRYAFQYLRYSQVLSEWRATDTGDKTRLQEIGWEVMAGGMQLELNQRLIAQILPDTDVAVDGLRHPIDYESLKNSFRSSFRLLYIDSPLKDRWEHLRGHSRYTSLGMFEAADSHPVEQQIESLRGSAGFVVRNNGSLQHLYVVVDEAIRHFRKADRE